MGKYNVTSGIVFEKGIKTLIYGVEGIGKTTLASKMPSPIWLDLEGSSERFNDISRYPTPTSLAMLKDEMADIVMSKEYKTIVIDTLDRLEVLVMDELCKSNDKDSIEDFGFGAGYKKLDEIFGKLLNYFDDVSKAGINITVIAHAKVKNFDEPNGDGSYSRYELKLGANTTQRVSSFVKEWADMVLFCNYKTEIIADSKTKKTHGFDGKRVMYTTHTPSHDAKNRFGLADELPLEYASIKKIYERFGGGTNKVPSAKNKTVEVAKNEQIIEAKQQEKEMVEARVQIEEALQNDKYSLLPKAMQDLLVNSPVDISVIEKYIATKGWFDKEAKITEYPQQFYETWLIPNWEKVMKELSDITNKEVETF